jgi:5'-phosphate synthase pdxT subunit
MVQSLNESANEQVLEKSLGRARVVAGAAGTPLGVLALQGDVREHESALAQIGVASRLVKRVGDLDGLAGLILPGGESTTLSMLLSSTGLWDPLEVLIKEGLPVLGTCAGLVLLAREVLDGRPDQRMFGALDVVVRRNGFGRQLQSFEAEVQVEGRLDGDEAAAAPLPAVFIRAPLVVQADSGVTILGSLAHPGTEGTSPVLVQQGQVLASVFHPELTPDRRVHRHFAHMCGC